MADSMPIPVPPRTPSPLSEDEDREVGLGIEGASGGSKGSFAQVNYDYASLSPPEESDSENMLSPTFTATFSPISAIGSLHTPYTPQTASTDTSFQSMMDNSETDAANPFNFTTQQYTAGKPPSVGRSGMGARRGHKYKHSSVSHQIFLEPAPRAPLQLPASLPIPTRNEVQKSMTSEQRTRLIWCACHLLVAAYVQWSAHGSLAMTALSRLLFFDAAGAVTCVVVDMMGNFEVWKRSSIKHPFG